jgi:hypothetical protein
MTAWLLMTRALRRLPQVATEHQRRSFAFLRSTRNSLHSSSFPHGRNLFSYR